MERKRFSAATTDQESDLPSYKPYKGIDNGDGRAIQRKRFETTEPQVSAVVSLDRRSTRAYDPVQLSILFVKHKGHLAKVAQELQCSRQTLYDYMNRYPDLKTLLVELREEKLDVAEEGLQALVEKKNLTAIMFTLRCLGAHRGWIDRDLGGGDGARAPSVVINIAPATGEGKTITTEIKPEYNRKFIDRDTPAMLKAAVEADFERMQQEEDA